MTPACARPDESGPVILPFPTRPPQSGDAAQEQGGDAAQEPTILRMPQRGPSALDAALAASDRKTRKRFRQLAAHLDAKLAAPLADLVSHNIDQEQRLRDLAGTVEALLSVVGRLEKQVQVK